MDFTNHPKKQFLLDLLKRTDVFYEGLEGNNTIQFGEGSLIQLFVPKYVSDKMSFSTKFGYLLNPVFEEIRFFLQGFDRETNDFMYSDHTEILISDLAENHWEFVQNIPLLSIYQIDYLNNERRIYELLVDDIEINTQHELRLFNKQGFCVLTLPYFEPYIGSK